MSGKTCSSCNQSFSPRKGRPWQRFCSKSCSTSFNNRNFSEATKRKISTTMKQRWSEHRQEMEVALASRDMSKTSARAKQLWLNPKFRDKIQAARKAAGYHRDPATTARAKIRQFAKNSLHRCLRSKTFGCFRILGYTTDQLRDRIEGQFTEGMSWGSYGRWEIDHIIPIAEFSTEAPVSEINALPNLRPLWKPDNRKKWKHYVII